MANRTSAQHFASKSKDSKGKKIKAKKLHLTVSLSKTFVALWLEFYELGGPLHYHRIDNKHCH